MSFPCNVCPRSCKVDRKQSIHEKGRAGYCRSGMLPIVSRAALHHWEEPCISGTRGRAHIPLPGVTCPVYIARIMRYLN